MFNFWKHLKHQQTYFFLIIPVGKNLTFKLIDITGGTFKWNRTQDTEFDFKQIANGEIFGAVCSNQTLNYNCWIRQKKIYIYTRHIDMPNNIIFKISWPNIILLIPLSSHLVPNRRCDLFEFYLLFIFLSHFSYWS